MRDADENSRKVTPPRPQPEPGVAFFLPQLIERLTHPTPGVRRVAILDLLRSPLTPDAARLAADTLARAIPTEPDEPTRLAMIRCLGRIGSSPEMGVLASIRDDRATPVALAHAATLAHDSIEVRLRSREV